MFIFQKPEVKPKKNFGQHFLTDKKVLEKFVSQIPAGATVIEIGAGPGQITEALLKQRCRVTTIEIDEQFKPFLDKLRKKFPKLTILYEDVLRVNFGRLIGKKKNFWLTGNLPYHITEPLLAKISALQIIGAVFLIGKRFAESLEKTGVENRNLGHLAILVNTFFESEIIKKVNKKSFYPIPRTNSFIVRLVPRKEEEFTSNQNLFILRELFRTAQKGTLLKNALKKAFLRFKKISGELSTKKQEKAFVENLGLSPILLNKSVEQLNNLEWSQIYRCL